MAFPYGWYYYKEYEQPGTSDGEQTDYQVEITVEHVLGKMRGDFGDVRFALEDGTELFYHLVSYTEDDEALFVVKIPLLPTTGTTIRCYYGNLDATTTSDPENVYFFFDNFNGAFINTDKWSIDANGVFSIDNGRLKNTGSFGKYMRAKVGGSVYSGSNYKIELILKGNGGYNEGGVLLRGQASPPANSYVVNPTITGGGRWSVNRRLNDASFNLNNSEVGTFTTNTDYIVVITAVGNNLKVFVNGTLRCSATDANFASGSVGIFAWGKTGSWYDDFRVSKITVNPPGVGVWGDEIEAVDILFNYFRGKFRVLETVIKRFRGKFEVIPEKIRFRAKIDVYESAFKRFRSRIKILPITPTYTGAIARFRSRISLTALEKKRFRAKIDVDSGKTRIELFANVKLRQSEFEDSFEDFEFTIGDQKYDT